MKKVLVTGATGFIGRHLIERLSHEKVEVIGVARSVSRKRSDQVSYISLDISKAQDFSRLPKGIDTIFHTAAFIPPDTNQEYFYQCLLTNTLATAHLLEWATKVGVEQIITSSSIAVYSTITEGKITESYQANPSTPYGRSKIMAENAARLYANRLHVTILRYPSVYGPGMKNTTIIPKFIELMKKGQDIVIHGTGQRTQDFIYVDDVVSSNIKAANRGSAGLFLIGSGRQTSLVELAKTIKTITKSQSEISINQSAPDDRQRVCFDYHLASKTFCFKPQYDLINGLKAML